MVISSFMGELENHLSEFNEITVIVFLTADLVREVLTFFCMRRVLRYKGEGGILREKLTHVANGAVYALCMT